MIRINLNPKQISNNQIELLLNYKLIKHNLYKEIQFTHPSIHFSIDLYLFHLFSYKLFHSYNNYDINDDAIKDEIVNKTTTNYESMIEEKIIKRKRLVDLKSTYH